MQASKFSDAQKAFILKQGADGIPVAEIHPSRDGGGLGFHGRRGPELSRMINSCGTTWCSTGASPSIMRFR
ncbi:hypothetical protein C3941_06240 [Kaistia algarum]|nr:hypothetical protein C3941_06240 [Kaistia algarum]